MFHTALSLTTFTVYRTGLVRYAIKETVIN